MTQEYLKSILHYEPTTGVFKWKKKRNGVLHPELIAGTIHIKGYNHIKINGKEHKSHRLAWLYMTGSFPVNQIDHKNRKRADNRFSNLREATNLQNQQNTGKRPNNTSGYPGVMWRKDRQKWIATLVYKGKRICFGSFVKKEDAINARKTEEIKYGFNPQRIVNV